MEKIALNRETILTTGEAAFAKPHKRANYRNALHQNPFVLIAGRKDTLQRLLNIDVLTIRRLKTH